MTDSPTFRIEQHPVHLGLGATVVPQPAFSGEVSWYEGYGQRHGDDGREGRLVAIHRFDGPWTTWEVHPNGEELVVCLQGEIHLVQEIDGERRGVTLQAGDAIVNPAGVWHTATEARDAQVLFVTAGEGTLNEVR